MDLNVTTDQQAQCLRLLRNSDGFMSAVDLAARMVLNGSRETRRRRVRAIVESLRADGNWIVAGQDGYAWTEDEDVWKDYNEGVKITGKRKIGVASRRQKMVTDNKGQGQLFGLLAEVSGFGAMTYRRREN